MTELFGAPQGIMAREEGNRAAMLGGLGAQKLLGEIAAQPVELDYRKSLARLHGAEATAKEAESAAQLQLLKLQQDWVTKEQDAREQLVDAAASQGRTATVADLHEGSAQSGGVSQADSLRRFADFAEQHGTPPMALAGLHDKIAGIAEKEAIGFYRNAQGQDIEEKRKSALRQRIGGIAQGASASPQAYAAAMMSPDRKLLPPELTGDYATDAPILRAVAQQSMTADQQADNARQDRDQRSRELRRSAGSAASTAAVTRNQAQADIATERLRILKKYGGDSAEETLKAKRTANEAAQRAMDAKDAKAYPPIPLNPKDIAVGDSYSKDGKNYKVVGKGPDGKPVFRPVTGLHAAAVAAAAMSANAGAGDEEED